MIMRVEALKHDLLRYADPAKAEISQRFFKTGSGQYGEGDKFLGVVVPTLRKIAKKYRDISFRDVLCLLESPFHEHRFVALAILCNHYQMGTDGDRKKVVLFYLRHRKYVNNWDLVDATAPHIIGSYAVAHGSSFLDPFARSSSLWERRIAIVATHAFIRINQYHETFRIARILINDSHDLIHKAVGWMLREVWKRSPVAAETFLDQERHHMSRTTLRYAIERCSQRKRAFYLSQ